MNTQIPNITNEMKIEICGSVENADKILNKFKSYIRAHKRSWVNTFQVKDEAAKLFGNFVAYNYSLQFDVKKLLEYSMQSYHQTMKGNVVFSFACENRLYCDFRKAKKAISIAFDNLEEKEELFRKNQHMGNVTGITFKTKYV